MPITADYISELERRHGVTPETQELRRRYVSPVNEPSIADYNSFDDEFKAKIDNSLFYSSLSGSDPDDVYDFTNNINQQLYDDENNISAQVKNVNQMGYWSKIMESAKRGKNIYVADIAITNAVFNGNESDIKTALEIRKKLQNDIALNPIEGNFFSKLLFGSANLAGQVIETTKRAGKPAIAFGAVGALAGGISSILFPTVGEELPATAGGAIAGLKLGARIGMAEGALLAEYQQGFGEMYAEMLEDEVNPEIAQEVASIAAITYALIGLDQLNTLLPGSKKAIKKELQKELLPVLLDFGKRYAKIETKEISEEVIQKFNTNVANIIAKILDGQKIKYDKEFLLEQLNSLWEEAKGAAEQFALFPLPSAAIQTKIALSENAKQQQKIKEIVLKSLEPKAAVEEAVLPFPPPTAEVAAFPEAPVTPVEPTKVSEAQPSAAEEFGQPAKPREQPYIEGMPDKVIAFQPVDENGKPTDKKIDTPFYYIGEVIKPAEYDNTGKLIKPAEIIVYQREANADDLFDMAESQYRRWKKSQELFGENAPETLKEKQDAIDLNKKYQEKLKEQPAKPPVVKEGLKAPLKELGGMPRQPPGLTKDEMAYLGKKQQQALRTGQKLGGKIGYKLGERAAYDIANSEIFKIKMAEKFGNEQRASANELVDAFVPAELQGRYRKRILEAKTEKRVNQIADAIGRYIKKAEKKHAINELKNFIKEVKSDYKNGKTTFGRLRKDVREQFMNFLEKYDLAKLTEEKAETLKSREDYVKRIAGEIKGVFESLDFEEGMDKDAQNLILIGDARIAELDRLSKIHIGELLDAKDIQEVTDHLKELIRVNELKGTIKERRKAEKLRDAINKAITEVYQESKVLGETKETLPTTKYITNIGQATFDTLIGYTTSKDNSATMNVLFNNRVKGTNKSYEYYKTIIEEIQQRCKEIDFTDKDFNGLAKTIPVVLGGKKIDLPIRKLAVLYAHTQIMENLEALLKTKGLNISIMERNPKYLYLFKTLYTTRTGKLSIKEIKEAVAKLPDKYRRLVDDVMFATNKNVNAPILNKASVEFANYEIADPESNYTNIPREVEGKIEGGILDTSTPPERRGRAIARVGGTNRIYLVDIDNEIIQQAQFAAEYAGMTEPLRDARTMLANKKWREKMKQTGNGQILKQMETLFRRSQGIFVDKSVLEKKMGQFLGSYGKSVLSLRLSGGLVQLTSPPASFSVIEPKYFATLKPAPLPGDIKWLKQRRPDLWFRWEGKGFDFILGDIASQHAFETMIFGKNPLSEKLLAQYTLGDEVSIYKIFIAAENKIAAETELKRGTPEFNNEVDELFNKAIRGQGQYDMLYRSDMTSSPNVVLKGSTLFMATNNAFLNTMFRSVDNYKKGRIGLAELSRSIGGVSTSIAMAVAVRTLFVTGIALGSIFLRGLFTKKDEEEIEEEAKKELVKRAKSLPLKIFYNLCGLSVFGQVFASGIDMAITAATKGYTTKKLSQIQTGNVFTDVGLDATEASVLTIKAIEQYFKRNTKEGIYQSGPRKNQEKWKDTAIMAADDIVGLIAYRYGLPYSGPKSDIYYPIKGAELSEEKSGASSYEPSGKLVK